MSGSCEQRCICLAEGTKRKRERRLLDEGQFVGNFQFLPSCSCSSPEEGPAEELWCCRGDQLLEKRRLRMVDDVFYSSCNYRQGDPAAAIAMDVMVYGP